MTIEGTERIFEPSLVTVVDHETEVPPRLKALSVAAIDKRQAMSRSCCRENGFLN